MADRSKPPSGGTKGQTPIPSVRPSNTLQPPSLTAGLTPVAKLRPAPPPPTKKKG